MVVSSAVGRNGRCCDISFERSRFSRCSQGVCHCLFLSLFLPQLFVVVVTVVVVGGGVVLVLVLVVVVVVVVVVVLVLVLVSLLVIGCCLFSFGV